MICSGESSSEIFSETYWKGEYIHTEQCFNVDISASADLLNWTCPTRHSFFGKETERVTGALHWLRDLWEAVVLALLSPLSPVQREVMLLSSFP